MRTIAIALAAALLAACGGSPSQQNDPGWTLKAVTWDGVSACKPLNQGASQAGSYDEGATQLVTFACPNGAPTASSGCVPGTGLPPPNDGPLCEPADLSKVGAGLTQICYFTCPGH